jgi:hypothetical protein
MTDRLVYHLDRCFASGRKTSTGPHVLADVNVECPVDKNPKLKIFISELILYRYQYTPAA